MMKYGAWFHRGDDVSDREQLALAKANGLSAIRSYSYGYAEEMAPLLREADMSLLGGMHVDAGALVEDWRSQVRLDELARYHELGVPLEAICVGNELREGGDAPETKRFTARLSFGLANVISAYRGWLDDHGYETPLAYAMEGIVFDDLGYFHEWLWPLVDVLDIIGLNAYPMGSKDWFTFGAFEESRKFLREAKARHDRLARFELRLRRALTQAASKNKPVIFTETGFPSAVGYDVKDDKWVIPEHDTEKYAEAMVEFLSRIRSVNEEYDDRIQALYFYEWRDNLHHAKIWNVEQSPIHVAFGLCDRFGEPKFDIKALLAA
ncbi:MAG: hypothetical protein ACP5JG_03155 [Anaerolineae bacterium]